MALDLKHWIPVFEKRVKKLEKEIRGTPKEIARWGATKAKTFAPKDTGSLIQAISWKSTKESGNKSQALIYVRDQTNKKYYGRSARVARYTALHHKMPESARFQAKSGEPHWAFKIRDLAKEKFGKDLRTKLDILRK